MYTLTLTCYEREAIDWVGHRYSNGDDLYELLTEYNEHSLALWDLSEDIKFKLPESTAWKIAENARKEDGDREYTFPCFAEELTEKMLAFCENIV